MIKTLTTVLALTVASVTPVAQAQQSKGDAKAGEGKIAMCIGCHGIQGYQASFPEVYKVPKISGQGAPYIVAALQAAQAHAASTSGAKLVFMGVSLVVIRKPQPHKKLAKVYQRADSI